ncbi:MAG: hypothetical protein U5L04_10390 [Trueperaceae bacterium]|nr:hypothetical protein [Trueperaceae bacterium]
MFCSVRPIRLVIFALFVVLLAGVSSSSQAQTPSGRYGALALNSSSSGAIIAKPAQSTLAYHTYFVAVPPNAETVTVTLDAVAGSPRLAVNAGAEINDYDTVDFIDLVGEGGSSHTLTYPRPGTLFIDVLNLQDTPARYTLTVTATTYDPDTLIAPDRPGIVVGAIRPGQQATGTLVSRANAASYHTYFVEVPEGTARLSVRMEADNDLDLALKHGTLIDSYSPDGTDYLDLSYNPRAEFVIDEPAPGFWYIDVSNGLAPGAGGRYTLSVDTDDGQVAESR